MSQAEAYPGLLVDTQSPQCYDAGDTQLQQFLLLCVVVAGKNSGIQQKKLDAFLQDLHTLRPGLPLPAIRELPEGELVELLVRHKLGQYRRLTLAFRDLATRASELLDLRTCTAQQLERVFGVGPKTARFFLLYTRRNCRVAVLDTHVLQWMQKNRKLLKLPRRLKIPRSTPSGERYAALEAALLSYCDAQGLNPAELDFEVWKSGQQRHALGKTQKVA